MKPDTTAPALQKRPQPGRARAIALAIAVHVAFFALIIFGVRWQNIPTPPVMAELWDKIPATKQAAPAPPAPKPEPKPAPPKPEPKPEPAPKPEEAKPAPPKPDPAIAEKAEREKREKAERERLEEEARKKKEQEEAAKKKKLQEEAARKKKEQEEVARKKREEDQRRREEEKAREEAERARAAAATARQIEMQKYVDRIKAKILSRANVPDTVPNGTELSVRIRILPGGDVLDIAVTHSASPTYSAAIERAIRSAQPLPVPDPTSELFPQFRDLTLNFRHER